MYSLWPLYLQYCFLRGIQQYQLHIHSVGIGTFHWLLISRNFYYYACPPFFDKYMVMAVH